MSQPSIPRSAAAALALSLCAASASAQVIVVGPAAGAIAQVPANGPMALALLLGALLLAAWWQLRRGPAAQRVLAWLAVVTLGVAMHSGGLLALPFNSFTNTAGETLTIPVTATTVGADFTGFQQEEFANQSGVALKVTALVPPNLGQCFTGANTADKLLQPGTPSASATPLCQVGTVLANNAACRVDVDAVCRGLLGAAPTFSHISPTSGPAAGGTLVTLTGSNLTNATGVSFGGVPGTSVTVVSAGQITAVTPAHAAGVVDVTVSTPAGMVKLAGGFTYIAVPAISSINPTSGSPAGGTSVTLNGSNFTGAMGVTFDGNPGTSVTVVNDSQIIVVTPAGAAGAVNVVVTTSNGSATAVGGFTYAYAVGQPLQGGVIATMNGSVPQLIAAVADLSSLTWGSVASVPLAQDDDAGAANTAEIVASQGLGTAAGACQQFNAGSNTDWYLPAKNQLRDLHLNRVAIGGFGTGYYWSSTEASPPGAWVVLFSTGTPYAANKSGFIAVRCVRNYTP